MVELPRGFWVAALCSLAISTSDLVAQQSMSGDAMIHGYLAADAAVVNQNELAGARSKEQWEANHEELRREYLDMLGLWPLPERTDLKAQTTGTVERDGFVVENVHFQSRPGLYVTANLYRPNPAPAEKLPAVLYVCGHSARGRDGNKTAFQHHGMWFATHGYVCMVLDTLQLGEIPGIHHGTYNRNRWWWQATGYTPAGVECWNGIRAIDYLTTRPEVDSEKVAVTGISGGGAATFWIAAADERVKVCVPVSGMSDLDSYVGETIINGHCDCMFLYNTYRWEWTTIAALIAPRPMLFENSGYDPIFPMPANERIRNRLERLYTWYQRKPGDLFDIGVTPGGHNDNVELRLMAYRWINQHLKNDGAEVSEPPLPPIEGELRVFPEDVDLPRDSINDVVDESFITLAKSDVPISEKFGEWSTKLRGALRGLVFRPWPDEVPAATQAGKKDDVELLETENLVFIQARTHNLSLAAPSTNEADKQRVWLIVLNPDERPGHLPTWSEGIVKQNDTSVVISPRGGGDLQWTRKNPPNYVERAHALLGRTVDGGRVWDVQSVARWLHEAEGGSTRSIAVVGRGQAGVIAAYAAILEPCIEEVVAIDPTTTHRDGPILLNVLRLLDVPYAFGLVAPRPVTIETKSEDAFQRTREIFEASGHGNRLTIREPASTK